MLTLKTSESEYERSANPENGLRLALLLAEGPLPVRDQGRALIILNGLNVGQASDSARALAALLMQVIEEQRLSIDKSILYYSLLQIASAYNENSFH